MKSFKILALALALVLLTFAFASCKSTPQATLTCTVSVTAPDDPIILNYSTTLTYPEGETPSVLDVARQALDEMEIKYELDEDGEGNALGFDSITTTEGTVYKVGYTDAEKQYIGIWSYTVDEVAPEAGRAGTNPAVNGSKISFTYDVASVDDLSAANP